MTQTFTPSQGANAEAAVVWVDRAHAVTIHIEADGRVAIATTQLPGTSSPEAENLALLKVVEAIGDARRVILLGDAATRTALEREYVAINGRPERLVELNLDQRPGIIAAAR
jgi:hypothetical protein